MTGAPDTLEMVVAADLAEVARVLDAIEAFGAAHGVPAKVIFRLNLALDELITNIVDYGLAERGGEGEIRLSVAAKNDVLDALLSDNGTAFDPLTAPVRELPTSIEDSEVGGLGIRFVRSHIDRLDYRRDGEFNRLHLQIDFNPADRPPPG